MNRDRITVYVWVLRGAALFYLFQLMEPGVKGVEWFMAFILVAVMIKWR